MMSSRFPKNKIFIAIVIFAVVIVLGLIIEAKQESSHSETNEAPEDSSAELFVPNS